MSKAKHTALQIISIIISMLTILSGGLTVNADTINPEDQISPLYATISNTATYMSINGIKATCYASVTADYSTSLSVKMELQKKKSNGYETIQTWSASKDGSFLELSKSRNINILSDYRIKVTFKADKESVTLYKYP